MQKRVFLAIPQHGSGVQCGTMQSVLEAVAAKEYDIQVCNLGLSLLARNFNTLFTHAWNGGFSHFVMLHADIHVGRPDGYAGSWLRWLVDSTDKLDCAMLSAVVPIKSDAGCTSTALDLETGNHYTLRRVTVRELTQLPPYFFSRSDVCKLFKVNEKKAGAFLVNSGCMCMPLRNPRYDWFDVRWPGFQIHDKLVWNKAGVPATRTESEDWCCSRWMHDIGWSYYATKDLRIDHLGHRDWSNSGSWGLAHDNSERESSIEEYEASG